MNKTIEIKLQVSVLNESTESPWWIIIDPHQMFKLDVHDVASMITGPFFSRAEAQEHLEARSYHYSDYAKVYCHSGWDSGQYAKLVRLSNNKPLAIRGSDGEV